MDYTNSTFAPTSALPLLPSYNAQPLSPLLPFISDAYLALLLPVLAYWVVSGIFHVIDVYDLFPQHRLHTPAEISKRNHVSRWEVFRDVIIQQVVQTAFGIFLTFIDEEAQTGMDDYYVARWASRLRFLQRAVPWVAGAVGLDTVQMAKNIASTRPALAGVLLGGVNLTAVAPSFMSWELVAAKAMYWYIAPFLQFVIAILIVDTWQYFLHRAMHMNKWLYTAFHSRHHRLYVPYAYGALYNHPFEGFLLDTLGAGLAYLVTGMTCRQSMWFFTCSTIKTVDDHCGYSLPWDPLQHLTSNNAGYHDIHHQSWGVKNNFSQPFFTFWDSFLGTKWVGGDVSKRYERTRKAAEQAFQKDKLEASNKDGGVSSSPADAVSANLPDGATSVEPNPEVLIPEKVAVIRQDYAAAAATGNNVTTSSPRLSSTRSKRVLSQSESLKGLKDCVEGKVFSVPRVESWH